MRIVVAPDSFKGSLSAIEVADCIVRAICKVFPEAHISKMPIADGGEGTVDTLVAASGGSLVHSIVQDPLDKQVSACWGILGDGETAVIEMAAASGLTLVPQNERNPSYTSTFGTGQLIKYALDRGCRKIIVGIGGSATNDGGVGMAQALGVSFKDNDNVELPRGGIYLENLATIDVSQLDCRLKYTEIVVACDVTNPLVGWNGASIIYGPQKGANEELAIVLDNCLVHYARIVENHLGLDISCVKGAGAAGGLGGGLMAFLNAKLMSGFAIVAEATKLEEHIKNADLVVTG
ncbi:MAG: glycerate kinase, partial [bacterium]|nr:glycerate kinase [bacterium]